MRLAIILLLAQALFGQLHTGTGVWNADTGTWWQVPSTNSDTMTSKSLTVTPSMLGSSGAATRDFRIPGHFYVIDFAYSTYVAFVPAVGGGRNASHYAAMITVSEVIDGEPQPIGSPFQGEFTDGQCWEDNPIDLVERALKANSSLTADVGAALDKMRQTAAIDALPLYSVAADGALEITARGIRDLTEIRVGGNAVWTNPNRLRSYETGRVMDQGKFIYPTAPVFAVSPTTSVLPVSTIWTGSAAFGGAVLEKDSNENFVWRVIPTESEELQNKEKQ